MSSRQAKRARVAALQSGDPVAAQARAEGNQARALEMRRAREAAANRMAAGRYPKPSLSLREGDRLDVPPADPKKPGSGSTPRLSRLALIPLLLAGLEAEERRQR